MVEPLLVLPLRGLSSRCLRTYFFLSFDLVGVWSSSGRMELVVFALRLEALDARPRKLRLLQIAIAIHAEPIRLRA